MEVSVRAYRCVAGRVRREEQVELKKKKKNPLFYCCKQTDVIVQAESSSVALCFSATSLNTRLLKHTHALQQQHSQPDTLTLTDTHDTHTRTRVLRVKLSLSLPHQQFFANDALVFLSLKALQNVLASKN